MGSQRVGHGCAAELTEWRDEDDLCRPVVFRFPFDPTSVSICPRCSCGAPSTPVGLHPGVSSPSSLPRVHLTTSLPLKPLLGVWGTTLCFRVSSERVLSGFPLLGPPLPRPPRSPLYFTSSSGDGSSLAYNTAPGRSDGLVEFSE